MRQHTWDRATLDAITCFAFVLLFCLSFLSPAGSRAAAVPKSNTCTMNIADKMETDCPLVKANDDRVLWTNTSSVPRSIHFDPNRDPFRKHKHCWDVPANAPPNATQKSGKILSTATPGEYLAYTSDIPCKSNPPDSGRGTPKVIIQ